MTALYPVPQSGHEFEEVCVLRAPLWDRSERRQVEIKPQRPSQPFAILAWGYRPESAIHQLKIGNASQLVCAVPGNWFSSMLTIEEFDRLLDKRPDGHDAVRALWRLLGYQVVDMARAEFGTTITLDLSGPFEQLVLLARMPEWTEWDRQFEEAKRRAELQ